MARASKRFILNFFFFFFFFFHFCLFIYLCSYLYLYLYLFIYLFIYFLYFIFYFYIIYINSEDQDVIGILEDIAEYVINTTGFFHSGAEPTINAMRKSG